MKKFAVIFLGLALVTASASAVPAQVSYIFDGDTFAARVSLDDDIKISVRVRIIDIDTPEINGECDLEKALALQAKDRLSTLLPIGSTVELSEIKDDKYLGRIAARVKNANGLNISEILIGEKLARPYGGGRRGSWCD
jgi:endonuclease YncB( thermonuclease family)